MRLGVGPEAVLAREGVHEVEGLVHAALAAEGVSGYLSSIPYWMPIITANFAFVPAMHRVKVMAAGTLGWSCLIDYIAHRDSHHQHHQSRVADDRV